MANVTAGPEKDVEFFRDLQDVFEKYPGAAKQYYVQFAVAELALGIDLEKQVKVNRVQNGEVISKFVDRESRGASNLGNTSSEEHCCAWRWESQTWRCVTMCGPHRPEQ
ncbi:hypothetical protein [Streptomyces sp. B1I3]|uniref:hypothetical protein n=1 Tax=Streptomyces sp. B1I3 TaxID=3042264 RepID=UPI0027847135|nr:hypothetical protein [Streptomyces sp. B1I3]MDQ0798199.1 hypothetical protein [Streptomyces sp. B1I3]